MTEVPEENDYPMATVAYYGPDDERATCVAVGIVEREGGEMTGRRWHVERGDARLDEAAHEELFRFVAEQGVRKVAVIEEVVGCPHEEGIDFPAGGECPLCPFWAGGRTPGETAH
jgi:hypothetical protein